MRKTALACMAMAIAVVCLPANAGAETGFGYPLAASTFAEAMATGPDGNLWFSGSHNFGSTMVIGKVTADGAVTEYPLSAPSGYLSSITAGPDGNLWFVERLGDAIGRISTDGEITTFALPDESHPTAITKGPDGNLWFTEGLASKVGRITPAGEVSEFSLPAGRHPSGITAGADGNLWFTERSANRIGRITPSGQVTEFTVPGPAAKLSSITAGPDGNIWFTEEALPRVGRITPAGQVAQFSVPTEMGTNSIVSGPGGLLWFAARHEVGAISTSGAISWPACLVRFCDVPARALAVGPDQELWVGTGVETCQICGGGSVISLSFRPGGIGRYELPPVDVGIGPRATRVRAGRTTLLLACGLPGGCRGALRLVVVISHGGKKHFRTIGKGTYALANGEAKPVPVRLTRAALDDLREIDGRYPLYSRALAGPVGHIEAMRGGIALTVGRFH